MLSSILDLPLLETIGSGIVSFLLFLVELGLYGLTLLFIFFIIKGFIKIPEIMGKIFIFVVFGLLAFICICLGYTIGVINIEGIFRV